MSSTQDRTAHITRLAAAYVSGDADAGTALINQVDEPTIATLPHEVRAVLMDALMTGKSECLNDRDTRLLKAALVATEDPGFLAARGYQYLAGGHPLAAETLQEWRVVLCAKKSPASDAHIEAMIDLSDVYQAGGKAEQARGLRTTAAATCERKVATDKQACARLLVRIANACFDASDSQQSETIAKKALALYDSFTDGPVEQKLDCLRVLHAVAQREKRQRDARVLARKIARLQGCEQPIDEIERALKTYVRLPANIDLQLRPEGICLKTDDFPRVVEECCGLDLKKYFIDAFARVDILDAAEKSKLAEGLFHTMRTVTSFISGSEGAQLDRSETTVIELPPAMTQGFVQKMTVAETVTFRLVPNPPDEAKFVDIGGITFSVGGKLVGVRELSLRAEGNKCIITPVLDQCGEIKQTAENALQALKNSGKDFLVGMYLKTQKIATEVPIALAEYRNYLADVINFKSSLQYKEKDLLSFCERASRIAIDDPMTRALMECCMRLTKKDEDIQLQRRADSSCDLGGVALKIAPVVKLQLLKKTTDLAIDNLSGINVKVEFDAPAELSAIGVDLKRSLPQCIIGLTLSAPDKNGNRRLITGFGPGRWIGVDLDENNQPATDAQGNWIMFGVTSNPISGAAQSFFLRLGKNNQLNMTTREIANLVSQTATEAFDPSDPSSWHWGAVALGAQTILTAGQILRSTIGDEETDKLAEDVKKVGKFFKKLLS